MRFKLDENSPEELIEELRNSGHDVTSCREENLGGVVDSVVGDQASQEGRILATFDLDFADIRTYPPGTHPGIIVFRIQNQDIASIQFAFAKLLATVSEVDMRGNLLIVEDSRIRIRRG